MNQTITSETARVGDQFTTTCDAAGLRRRIEVIPAGSEVVGRVTTVNRAQRKSKAGTIGVHFVSLRCQPGLRGQLTAI